MNLKGFTPAIDALTMKYGIITSSIYGRMWRFSKMSPLGICSASQEKIGDYLKLDRSTVNRHIKILKDEGLIIEAGRGVGGTITYAPQIEIDISIEIDVAESDIGSALKQHIEAVKSNTKKEVKKEEDTKQRTANAVQAGQKLSGTIRADFKEHLGLSPTWETKTNQQYYLFFRERYVDGQTAKMFATWWRSDDFRAKQNISLFKVKEQWYQAFMSSEIDHDFIKPL